MNNNIIHWFVYCFQMGQDPNKLGSFNGVIVCEPPNNHLNKFEGYLEWNGKR